MKQFEWIFWSKGTKRSTGMIGTHNKPTAYLCIGYYNMNGKPIVKSRVPLEDVIFLFEIVSKMNTIDCVEPLWTEQ